eukprot:scaffold85453_cov54-Phaeocystis_antarctica.AAC.2
MTWRRPSEQLAGRAEKVHHQPPLELRGLAMEPAVTAAEGRHCAPCTLCSSLLSALATPTRACHSERSKQRRHRPLSWDEPQLWGRGPI